MPPISIMMKPSSSLCNLKCGYCFYHSLAEMRESYSYGFMKEETAEEVIKKAFDFTRGNRVYLSFQGGEPMLRGIDFFKSVSEYIGKYNIYGSEVSLALQTNGTLINDDWCKFFQENNYLIGVSLDGDRAANIYRVDKEGGDTFDKVSDNIDMLINYGVDFNILSVVTSRVAENIDNIYYYFRQQGYKHLQFIPCLAPLNTENREDDFYMNEKQYGDFLIRLFKLYYHDVLSGNYISVRQMDNLVRLAANLEAEQCGMNGHCSHQFIIEGDGGVFPCDFYCLDEYRLGNIYDTDFHNLSRHEKAIDFIKESLITDEKCKSCKYFKLCRGGCKREREYVPKCGAYKRFFDAVLPYLIRLKEVI